MSRGWTRDREGWWRRPIYRRDLKLSYGEMWRAYDLFPIREVRKALNTRAFIGSQCHAFFEGDRLYCRNAKQKRRLDNGLTV